MKIQIQYPRPPDQKTVGELSPGTAFRQVGGVFVRCVDKIVSWNDNFQGGDWCTVLSLQTFELIPVLRAGRCEVLGDARLEFSSGGRLLVNLGARGRCQTHPDTRFLEYITKTSPGDAFMYCEVLYLSTPCPHARAGLSFNGLAVCGLHHHQTGWWHPGVFGPFNNYLRPVKASLVLG